jgi:type I restriction enzyme M protein
MFVSSARFVSEDKMNPAAELSIHDAEKTDETGPLCRLNLAMHGLKVASRYAEKLTVFHLTGFPFI